MSPPLVRGREDTSTAGIVSRPCDIAQWLDAHLSEHRSRPYPSVVTNERPSDEDKASEDPAADVPVSEPAPTPTVDASPPPSDAPSPLSVSGQPLPATSRSSGSRVLPMVIAVTALVVLIGLAGAQIVTLSFLSSTRDDLAAARDELADLDARVTDVGSAVDGLDDDVSRLASIAANGASSSAPATPAGALPRHVQGQQDTALGMTLGSVSGPDAYAETSLTIEPADGTKRVWMVWAHWCPYCQQELPLLKEMYDDLRTMYPGIDIVTVTSSIDEARGNPLDAYLQESAFPFPVVVDEDLAISGQLGVSAFPFWVVTDGDGTVLLRLSGYLDADRMQGLVTSLDEYGT